MTNFTPITDGMTGNAATFNSRFQELSDAIDATALGSAAVQLIVNWTELLVDAATIYLSGIPQTYKHLILNFALGGDTGNADGIIMTVNEASDPDYYWRSANINTALSSTSGAADTHFQLVRTATGNTSPQMFSTGYVFFHDYTSVAQDKAYYFDAYNQASNASANMYRAYGGGVWKPASPVAITAIRLQPLVGGNFRAGSSYQLLGVAA